MLVYEAIAADLVRRDVRFAFGLVGSETLKLTVDLERRGIRYLNSRHDSAAVGMADGYARATGRVGVALLERGPGFTNGLTALVAAAKAGTPLVVFAGDASVGLDGPDGAHLARQHAKHVDQAGVADAAGIRQITLRSPASALADVAAAFACAATGTTVLVNLPRDVGEAPAGSAPAQVTLEVVPRAGAPDAAAVAELSELLTAGWAAQRPVILAGRGAVRAGAGPALRRLGDRTGALLATSLLGRSLFAGDPYDIGIAGTLASPLAAELLAEADLVLAFGAALNRLQTMGGALFPRARIVHLDADPRAFERWLRQPDLAIVGDARLAADALVSELDRRGHRATGFRTPDVAARIAGFDRATSFRDAGAAGALDPRTLRLRLDAVLPPNRRIVCDVGAHTAFTATYLAVAEPSAWVCFTDCSALGSAPGVALGAAVAAPDVPTVLAIGDGGLMMTLGELETAVRYRIPLIVLVMNDAAYGAEVQAMRTLGLPERVATFPDLPFAEIARALGAEAATVRTLDDVAALAGRFAGLQGPFVVDCKVSNGVRDDALDAHERLSRPLR